MSATFKLAKKKFTQHDLRKLMNEQKPKTESNKKIDSPLAKYNELGQLTCVLCKSVVRSEDVWKVHINAKQHKQNIDVAKKLKEQTNNFSAPKKRPATPPLSEHPEKKIKGILKNSATATFLKPEPPIQTKNAIPSDFFDSKTKIETNSFFEAILQKTSIRKDLLNIKQREQKSHNMDEDSNNMETESSEKDEVLPEGFFDDPIKDAKARNLEYKDPVEEEWEKFQKEIKAAANFSNAIIAEDQEEATTERQIDEIDEQIRNWSRVLNLEKKKEEVVEKEKLVLVDKGVLLESESDDDNDEFEEYLDWRAKQSHK